MIFFVRKLVLAVFVLALFATDLFSQHKSLGEAYWEAEWVKEQQKNDIANGKAGTIHWSRAERSEVILQADDYVESLERQKAFLHDPDLDAYLQEQLSIVHAGAPNPKLGINLQVKVLISHELNAFALGNGTIVLTTGIFDALRSEGELQSVLIHELSHIYLDHHVHNFKALRRKANWAKVLSVAASAATVAVVAANDDDRDYSVWDLVVIGHVTHDFTYALSSVILEGLYIKHSKKQEYEADALTKASLVELGVDPQDFPNILGRVYDYQRQRYLSNEKGAWADYRQVNDRLGKLKMSYQKDAPFSASFDVNTLNAHLFNMRSDLVEGRYSRCLELIGRIEGTGFASEGLMVAKARSALAIAATPEEKLASIRWYDKAERLAPEEHLIWIQKEKVTELFAIKEYSKAQEALPKLRRLAGRHEWAFQSSRLEFENWLNEMEFKVGFFLGKS
ncbi:hypothetical protein FUAX_11320 [Fulvitalea axinellae]|uniref:Peptidase M48 domain-containing protein n=1 Tax=Fulvitalea axinellae TaxID=1182444 RepID=A0AAU9D8V0_9BACT|nr:hypothetical protein FUAX_11320 [Fulvitalea axinellae]